MAFRTAWVYFDRHESRAMCITNKIIQTFYHLISILGPVPNPEDCSTFYLCDFNDYTLEYCPDENLFDDILLVCNYDYAVDCGDRPRPDHSTTSTMSTITPTTGT